MLLHNMPHVCYRWLIVMSIFLHFCHPSTLTLLIVVSIFSVDSLGHTHFSPFPLHSKGTALGKHGSLLLIIEQVWELLLSSLFKGNFSACSETVLVNIADIPIGKAPASKTIVVANHNSIWTDRSIWWGSESNPVWLEALAEKKCSGQWTTWTVAVD